MSSQDISVELSERQVLGKGLNALRSQGLVPAVIHDHGNPSVHVMGDYMHLVKMYQMAGKHHPVELRVGDKKHLALIKDVDLEPVKSRMRHIVFQAIKQNEKVTAEIPVILTGEEIPAEKASLLVLTQLDTVSVEAFPKDLPDQLTVDATVLTDVGDKLHVSDIKAPAGVVILTDPETSIATVEMPKDQIAEADAAAQSLAEDAGTTEEATEESAAEGETDTETEAEATEE